MSLNRTVLFRVDGGHRLGLGHVKRCLALAAVLARQGMECKFAGRFEGTVADMIREQGYPVISLPGQCDLTGEIPVIDADDRFDGDIAVLDISHRETFKDIDAIPDYFAGLRQRFARIAVIDGSLNECLVGRFNLPIDLAVVPYAGADAQTIKTRGAELALGTDYFILHPDFAALAGQRGETAVTARKLLVTAGGSDPAGITLKVLNALDQLAGGGFECRIVIGPAFDEKVTAEIAAAAGRSKQAVELIHQPDSLAEHMAWCDMAVSASGLTKYELAAMNVPALLLSIDRDHVRFNEPFDGLAASRHAGIASDIPVPVLAKAIEDLAGDADARTAMSEAGRTALDCGGAESVAGKITAMAASGSHQRLEPQGSRASR